MSKERTGLRSVADAAASTGHDRRIIAGLQAWYLANGRHTLPWRQTHDPYKILVSELMLQQTQVSRVIPKYEAFIEQFPSLQALAQAERAQVLRLWQGLGYNSRALRLHLLARLQRELPQHREELLALPGIGPYTAGAIMIFAHNMPAVSIDVNIRRVLKRLCWAPAQMPTEQELAERSLALLEQSGNPRGWHAALMDFGSSICIARAPRCHSCPLYGQCKTRGTRADEQRRGQSKFLGSNRWWRGQILKQLLIAPVHEQHLLFSIKANPDAQEQDLYAGALEQMLAEGIIRRKGKLLCIKE